MASSFLDNVSAASNPQLTGPSAPSGPVMPTQAVAGYQNQQLGGLLTKTASSVGTATSQPVQTTQIPQSPVANIATTALDSVKAASQRMNSLSVAVQARKAAQAAQAASQGSPSGNVSVGSGGYVGSNGGGMNFSGNKNLSSARNQALKTAYSYVGDPYVLGGVSHRGIDCSGLVMAVYDQFGLGRYIDNHSSRMQGQIIPGVRTSVRNLQPGDIVAWRDGSHIAIYAGNGMIVSAADYGEGVKYQPVWGDVYGIHIRLPGE